MVIYIEHKFKDVLNKKILPPITDSSKKFSIKWNKKQVFEKNQNVNK